MKHVIIGTAGHVDHGKTLLVKALTNIDTDRLAEEKKRGITIELGFAHLDWPDGTQAGIVDVPGHEKFIKNMLAGAGGIDLCMLVVASDEGFMPQTIEHLDILTLLGIRDGLVVLTKKDTVDPEWLEMMREEVKDRVRGTFLEGKPVMEVSAVTGEGIPELREELYTQVRRAAEKSTRVPFRLPIDRVFSVDGFGTVVTGTLIEGCVTEGEEAELAPSGAKTRIRNLQVHGRDVETAYAGQRVAVNLAGLKKTDVRRGDSVVRPGSVHSSRMLDVRLRNLPDSGRVITDQMQAHLYHGSAVELCKLALLDRESLVPGESCYAQLRMSEPVAAKIGDRFVIRFYSPLETIGGGVILDDTPARHKRNDPAVLKALEIKESGSGGDRVLQVLAEQGTALPNTAALAKKLAFEPDELTDELRVLIDRGRAVEPLPGRYAASSVVDTLWETCRTLLEAYHKQNPLHAGMGAAELRQKLFRAADQTVADAFLSELCREGYLKRQGASYALSDFEVRFTKRQNAVREKLVKYYRDAGVEPASMDEVTEDFAQNERADCKQVMESLMSGGELILLAPRLCVGRDAYLLACRAAQKHFETSETLTLAELRDALGTSRKYALALLEQFDRSRITKKDGDARKLNLGFAALDL